MVCESGRVDTTSPTARALLCLELLHDRPGITADRLGEQLGVTSRAARRYVGILREAGVPVESTRGPYGGYRVGRGLRLPPLTFTSVEALGLVMAVLDGHHDAGNPVDPVGSALVKIMRALPEAVAAQADAVRRTAASAPDRAAARPDPSTAANLVTASAEHRRVRVTYHSESGSTWEVEVDPWAVVVRHGRWYLLCLARPVSGEAAVRTYRVDRVSSVEVQEAMFTPPPDLDPVALLEHNLATGWEYAAEVVIEAAAERVTHWLAPRAGSDRGDRRPHLAPGREHEQPVVVRRAAGRAAYALPHRRLHRAPGGRTISGDPAAVRRHGDVRDGRRIDSPPVVGVVGPRC